MSDRFLSLSSPWSLSSKSSGPDEGSDSEVSSEASADSDHGELGAFSGTETSTDPTPLSLSVSTDPNLLSSSSSSLASTESHHHVEQQQQQEEQPPENENEPPAPVWPGFGRATRQLIRRISLVTVVLASVLLAFTMGSWLGTMWEHSRMMKTPLSQTEKLQAQDHQYYFQQIAHFEQQAEETLQKERAAHQETARALQERNQQLADRLKEAQGQVDRLMTAIHQYRQQCAEYRAREAQHATGCPADQERKDPGRETKGSTFHQPNSHNQESADTLSNLYFSFQREIGLIASSYLRYLREGVNVSEVVQYVKESWEASRNRTITGLSQLREKATHSMPAVLKEVPATVSKTYQAVARSLYKHTQPQPNKGHPKNEGKENHDQERKDPGRETKGSTFHQPNSHNQESADTLSNLYFSFQREIGLIASSYLRYLREGVNVSEVVQYVKESWEASRNRTITGLSQLREKATHSMPAVLKEVPATVSKTYQAVARSLYKHTQPQPNKGHPKNEGKENHDQERKDPGRETKGSTFHQPNSHNQESADMLSNLYFSFQREIGLIASSYLRYLREGVNVSEVVQYVKESWEASRNRTITGLSQLREKATHSMPAVLKEVPATVSKTYQAVARSLYKHTQPQPNKGHPKNEGKENHEGVDDESDNDVMIESEEDDEWKVKREDSASRKWTKDDDFHQRTKDFREEDKAYSRNEPNNTWSNNIAEFLQKTLSNVENRLQETWHKMKNTSMQFLSVNSDLVQMAAKMKKDILRFFSDVQKSVQDWLKGMFWEESGKENRCTSHRQQ